MKELTVKQGITYRWWCEGSEVRKAHVEELKAKAENHIRVQMRQGFTSGELLHRTKLRGISYRGYWEVNEAEPELPPGSMTRTAAEMKIKAMNKAARR